MRRTSSVLLVLLSMMGLAAGGSAQQDPTRLPGRQASEFSIEQNYPNPVTSETRIPFTLSESLFAEGGPVVVSIRIVNVIQQFVASPSALRHPVGEGVPVMLLEYHQPGRHEALWNAQDRNGQRVVPGVYWVQLTVNGASRQQRMFVSR
jgi:hypothetical protein